MKKTGFFNLLSLLERFLKRFVNAMDLNKRNKKRKKSTKRKKKQKNKTKKNNKSKKKRKRKKRPSRKNVKKLVKRLGY